MSYVLVQDIPASWERYEAIAEMLGHPPRGLLLHVAGPTDEGFRIVEVWASEAAWRSSMPDFEAALHSIDPDLEPRAVVRDLHPIHVVVGEPWPETAAHDWIAVGPGDRGGRLMPEQFMTPVIGHAEGEG